MTAKPTFPRDVVRIRAAEDVHVGLAPGLLLRQDNLHAVCVIRVGDGVALQGQPEAG